MNTEHQTRRSPLMVGVALFMLALFGAGADLACAGGDYHIGKDAMDSLSKDCERMSKEAAGMVDRAIGGGGNSDRPNHDRPNHDRPSVNLDRPRLGFQYRLGGRLKSRSRSYGPGTRGFRITPNQGLGIDLFHDKTPSHSFGPNENTRGQGGGIGISIPLGPKPKATTRTTEGKPKTQNCISSDSAPPVDDLPPGGAG